MTKNPGYHKGAVDKAIASSNRSGRKIGGREARLIHRVLSAPTVADAMRVGSPGGAGAQFEVPAVTDHSNVREDKS
jgi:hypothetical protein